MKRNNIARSLIIFCICAILLYYVYTLFRIGSLLIYTFQLIFPVIIALFFHFLIDPLIDYFTSDRLSRKVVVTHLYLSFSLFFILSCYFLIPYLLDQCLIFYHRICDSQIMVNPIFSTFIRFLEEYQVIDYFIDMFNGWTQTVIYWVGNIFIALGISFYLSYDNLHLIEKAIVYLPFEKQGICMQTLKKLKLTTYQFMKSMILDFFFFFLMCFIPFFFINQNFAVWIALFLSLTNLIPYVGPYIGGIPVVIYEFFIDQHLGYASLIVIMVLQYLESSYLQPYLFSKGIHLHPILLLIALTFFGDLFGLIGMIFSPLLLSYVVFIGELFKNLRIGDDIKRIMHHENR